MILVLGLLTQAAAAEWSADLEESLARAREREAVLCVAVLDDSPASHETLKSIGADPVRPLAAKFFKVKVPIGGKGTELLPMKWTPMLFLFEGRREPPPSAEDQACAKALREKRVSVSFHGVDIAAVAAYWNKFAGVRIILDPSITSPEKPFDLERVDAMLGDVIRAAADAAGGETAIMDGSLVIAAKGTLRLLRLRRELDSTRAGVLEGLPELVEGDRRVTEILRRPIDLDLRGAERVRDAAARWNEALGEAVIQPTDLVGRSFIRETRFKKCNGFTILDHLEAEPKFVWYQKGGKVILSDKPEIVAITPPRLRSFIIESVECEESLLPDGAVKEIEVLAARLAGDLPEERERAIEGLRQCVQRSATSKAVLRRLHARTGDSEVRARLEALINLRRDPFSSRNPAGR